MKNQTFIAAIFSLFIIGLVSSCEKDDINTPTFELKFNTVTTETNLKSASANSIEFTSGYFILENIEFEIEADTDSLEMEFEIDSFITIDFTTGDMTPDLSSIEILPGIYTELELEFELWDQTDQPSIYLEGTWTDANDMSHPVRLIMPVGQTFSLEIEGEFTVEEGTAMVAEITIDPNTWFVGEAGDLMPLATANEEDIIVISPVENADIYDSIKDAIDYFSEVEIEME